MFQFLELLLPYYKKIPQQNQSGAYFQLCITSLETGLDVARLIERDRYRVRANRLPIYVTYKQHNVSL